ncbi:MAG: aminopeptidase P family protein [Deltaproteobacteria bacterium]|nr:aminopeptidase P family protein [Deltaproteobacteria bacterium]
MSAERYADDELDRIRALQQLAYRCAEAVAASLTVGTTEREAAARLGDALRAAGAQGFFHTPFAWFGERAAFVDHPAPSLLRPWREVAFVPQFFPSERRLEAGMVGILDVAPIQDGLCADIGYAFAEGGNHAHPGLRDALEVLRGVRGLVLAEVRRERTMREVYQAVDTLLGDAGYENAHTHYPSHVLGHKLGRLPLGRLPAAMVAGFDWRTYLYFGRQLAAAALPGAGRVPLWNQSALADARPDPGLWAIEPHLRKGDLGAKWEELLVITDSDARWLDDDLPHVRAVARAA